MAGNVVQNPPADSHVYAAVYLADLPLQLALSQHPEWQELPVCIVAADTPQALVQFVNDKARTYGVKTGMRYAAALSLCSTLCADVYDSFRVQELRSASHGLLQDFSPGVEWNQSVFVLDVRGMHHIYPSARNWLEAITQRLREEMGLQANIVVGFRYFAVQSIVRAATRSIVLLDSDHEMRVWKQVPLSAIVDEPALSSLHQLGVFTMQDLATLPEAELYQRFGRHVWHLHTQYSGRMEAIFRPVVQQEPVRRILVCEPQERNYERLLFRLQRTVEDLVRALEQDGKEAVALQVILTYAGRSMRDASSEVLLHVQPARPTGNIRIWMDLIRLHLVRQQQIDSQFPSRHAIVSVELEPEIVCVRFANQDLPIGNTVRDTEAALYALARVRAQVGPGHVFTLEVTPGHFHDARMATANLERLRAPDPHPVVGKLPLVRAMFREVLPCSLRLRRVESPMTEYVVAGNWWTSRPQLLQGRNEVRHRYFWIQNDQHEWFWLCYDCVSQTGWQLAHG